MSINLDTLTLAKGAHDTRADGVCLLEAVAWFAGQEHTDYPPCVSPVLAAFGRTWNDALDDTTRQTLRPFIPLLPGTADDGLDLARSYLALDWLVRTYTPAFLDAAGLTGRAAGLRGLAPLTSTGSVQVAGPAIAAVWAAARAAARDAAGAAAGDAVWAAARAAARDAVWAAAGDAARAAARAAVWAAARAAARAALVPVVTELQASALALFTAMIHPEPGPV